MMRQRQQDWFVSCEPFASGVIPYGMKVAVSIPNNLFEVAERLARRSGKSRSRLFSDALREYVARRSPDKITEATDQAVAEIGNSTDPFVAAASCRRLEQSEW